jgi:hypothetical protein
MSNFVNLRVYKLVQLKKFSTVRLSFQLLYFVQIGIRSNLAEAAPQKQRARFACLSIATVRRRGSSKFEG